MYDQNQSAIFPQFYDLRDERTLCPHRRPLYINHSCIMIFYTRDNLGWRAKLCGTCNANDRDQIFVIKQAGGRMVKVVWEAWTQSACISWVPDQCSGVKPWYVMWCPTKKPRCWCKQSIGESLCDPSCPSERMEIVRFDPSKHKFSLEVGKRISWAASLRLWLFSLKAKSITFSTLWK